MMVFQCPECHVLHDEPLEATYQLAVCCTQCLSEAPFLGAGPDLAPEVLQAAWASVTRASWNSRIERGREAA